MCIRDRVRLRLTIVLVYKLYLLTYLLTYLMGFPYGMRMYNPSSKFQRVGKEIGPIFQELWMLFSLYFQWCRPVLRPHELWPAPSFLQDNWIHLRTDRIRRLIVRIRKRYNAMEIRHTCLIHSVHIIHKFNKFFVVNEWTTQRGMTIKAFWHSNCE